MFLVSSDVGNLLRMLDETTAYNVILHDDAFADNIKEIYELPCLEILKKDIMIFRSESSVNWFFSTLKLTKLLGEDTDSILEHILIKIKKENCCLIYYC